jgi:hypothetical protein
MRRRVVVFGVLAWAAAHASLAQPKEPIGRYIVEVRGASAGVPAAEGWTPTVTSGTIVPSRGLAVDAGAHFYPFRFGGGAIGVGATWLLARGRSSPLPAPAGTSVPAIPQVTTQLSSLSPQISLNFGHGMGWSYLSAGLGRTRVRSEAMFTSPAVLTQVRESEWIKTLNYGGGARWFLTDHVGLALDLRWHKVSLAGPTATHPGAPRASVVTAGAGIVLKP